VDNTYDFSEALDFLKDGLKVRREGWNGNNMFLFLVQGSTFTVDREPLVSILGKGTAVNYHAHIDIRTTTGEIVPWTASQADLLSEDWLVAGRFTPI